MSNFGTTAGQLWISPSWSRVASKTRGEAAVRQLTGKQGFPAVVGLSGAAVPPPPSGTRSPASARATVSSGRGAGGRGPAAGSAGGPRGTLSRPRSARSVAPSALHGKVAKPSTAPGMAEKRLGNRVGKMARSTEKGRPEFAPSRPHNARSWKKPVCRCPMRSGSSFQLQAVVVAPYWHTGKQDALQLRTNALCMHHREI